MDRLPPVLIAEDESTTRALLENTLVKAGYDVTAVDNGHKALRLFNEKYFPIVFTDWIMPEMDGLDLCRAIRTSPTPGYVFIVILTGRDSPTNIITGLEAGADDYLTKPFQPAELIARLRTARRILELERALQKSNEGLRDQVGFLERFIDTIPNPTFYRDIHGVLRACNSAFAQQIVGKMQADIIGLSMDTLPGLPNGLDISGRQENGTVREQGRQVHETSIKCADGVVRDFLFSQSTFSDPSGKPSGIVGTLSDMTEKNNLLAKQELNIGLAKQVLNAINGPSPRYIRLCANLVLFIDAISVPCHAEGGDHYFVHNLSVNGNGKRGKTVLSLKDQSGHEVGCILRSIHTDLLHHLVFHHNDDMGPELAVSRLNDEICRSGVFNRDDFFTAINAELDHETLVLKYVSAGHPPFLLIRGNEVMDLPKPEDPGSNLPVAIQEGIVYSAGVCQLREKDKLIFFTDGLTEMPFKNHNKCIGNEELKMIVKDIISEDPDLPVSDIMYAVLDQVATMSDEQVVPFSKNTSGDDVTILCMEIENRNDFYEEVWKPYDANDLSRLISSLYERIKIGWNQRAYETPLSHVQTVLEEMAIKAWIHGNNKEPNKAITLRWRFGNDFHLEIIHEGKRFDCPSIPAHGLPQNIANPYESGMPGIEGYADSVDIEANGKHVILSFRKYELNRRKNTHKHQDANQIDRFTQTQSVLCEQR